MSKDKKIPKIWGKGPVKVWNVEIECYILEDGTSVLNKGKMMTAIGRSWKGSSRTDRPNFIGAVNIQPFISSELEEMLGGITFLDGTKEIAGYHSDILPLVCDVYLRAREAGVLTASQLPIAQTCELLVRAFSRVGFRAVIYEQLGYEKIKQPEVYRMLVESYMAEEVRRWAKEFPDEFFWQMDRIYGNEKTTPRNRPQYYAKFIRKYIYQPIEKGLVLEELDKINPTDAGGNRKKRFHSYLNEDKGLNSLKSQIWQVLGILKTSASKRTFENNYARMMGNSYQGDLFGND